MTVWTDLPLYKGCDIIFSVLLLVVIIEHRRGQISTGL